MIHNQETVYAAALLDGLSHWLGSGALDSTDLLQKLNRTGLDDTQAGETGNRTSVDAVGLLEEIILKAGEYSSGSNKNVNSDLGEKSDVSRAKGSGGNSEVLQMRSVFENISLSNAANSKTGYKKWLPLEPLNTGSKSFPTDAASPDNESRLKALWDDFTSEWETVQKNKAGVPVNELLTLLEKYASRIPAGQDDAIDVSLYDFLKTRAAFALCLYDYMESNGSTTLPTMNEKPFALVGGALSGIQKFIYSIVAKGAAKNLKGRSFYLQLLTDNVVQLVLEELGLQKGNIIYASGGGFYLLAPNTADLPEKLKNLEAKIAKKLFEHHGTDLYLALDFQSFGEPEIFGQTDEGDNIGKVWKSLGEKLSVKKGQRFSHILTTQYEQLFTPLKVAPETKRDSITGEELGTAIEYLDDKKQQPVKAYTWKQIELGKNLKKADYWIISKEKLPYLPARASIDPIGLGTYNYLLDAQTLKEYDSKLAESSAGIQITRFNREKVSKPSHTTANTIYGLAWYGGNDFPENQFGDPKIFDELAGVTLDRPNYKDDAEKESGPELTRLGVLRMDVDNLGAIFRRGLHPSKRSFSRYSTLSRSLDWFFKGYLNTIWDSKEEYQEYTQIIYSGGDDLFIVGKWDVLIQMAADIQKAFKKWVCYNRELTLSGGMAIVGPRFPVLKSAAYSETLEKAAKKHSYGNQEKNAFAFLSYTPQRSVDNLNIALNWETEYPYLHELKNEIKSLMKSDLSEGFASAIYNLMQQAEMTLNEEGRYYPTQHRITWLAAYQFKRNSDDKSDILKEFFRKWANAIMTGKCPGEDAPAFTQYHALQYLALASRWAALEERSIIKTKKT